MKIEYTKEHNSNYVMIPFWTSDYKTSLALLPKAIQIQVEQDMKYLSGKWKHKKYFYENQEFIVVSVCKEMPSDLDIIREMSFHFAAIIKKECFSNATIKLFPKLWSMGVDDLFSAAVEGLIFSEYSYDHFKKKKHETFEIDTVFIQLDSEIDSWKGIVDKQQKIMESVFLTADLTNGPSNYVTISHFYSAVLNTFEDAKDVKIKHYQQKHLEEMNMNLIIAVGKGSKQEPSLIEVQYNSDKKDLPHIILVGKGVVFDSGGYNLKPTGSLFEMKCDMAGAATVLGIIKGCNELSLPYRITGLMPLAENMVSAGAFKTGDIYKGFSGKSVEIKNTDAEGRLILSDALSYADTLEPDIVIDFATLTGAAIVGLGTRIAPCFYRDRKVKEILELSADNCGEPVWELPLFKEYKKYLESDIADISNIGNKGKEAGTITAALFLSEFTKNPKWVHCDIAGPAFVDYKWKYFPKGGTGFMVRTIINFIENYTGII